MPALKFKTCRLLSGNVWNKELTIVQRRILGKLRMKKRSIKKKIYSRKNRNSYIQLQTTRKLSLFYGNLPITKMHRRTKRTSYIPFLLNLETRLDVILVRLHFCETIPQARQLISHRKVCVNNGIVNISHFQVSHGDIISFQENYARTRGEEIRRFFYIKILVEKIIGKFWGRWVRMQRRKNKKRRSKKKWLRRVRLWRRSKTEWFRRLKTKKECRLLLKDRFLQKLHSSMQKEDLKRTKKFGSDAEHNRMKRNFYHSVTLSKKRMQRRIKRIELPTHYSEVNHRTLKAVVFYGPNIDHIPHDIRLKDLNLLLWSGKGRGQNT